MAEGGSKSFQKKGRVAVDACERARSRMVRYLDERLSPAQRAEVERHLASCFACEGVLMSARRRREAFHRAVRESLAEEPAAPERLRETVRVCLRCLSVPGSVRCPRLRPLLRLVGRPP